MWSCYKINSQVRFGEFVVAVEFNEMPTHSIICI